RFAVEDAEIDGEENEYEANESRVKPPVFRKRKKLNHTSSFHNGKVLVVEPSLFPIAGRLDGTVLTTYRTLVGDLLPFFKPLKLYTNPPGITIRGFICYHFGSRCDPYFLRS